MAKNEAYKLVARKGTGLWSSIIVGHCAVRYSCRYWTKPKSVWCWGDGARLSVFWSLGAAYVSAGYMDEIWRCKYRGTPQEDEYSPTGTLRVTSVRLIEKVWPKDGSG